MKKDKLIQKIINENDKFLERIKNYEKTINDIIRNKSLCKNITVEDFKEVADFGQEYSKFIDYVTKLSLNQLKDKGNRVANEGYKTAREIIDSSENVNSKITDIMSGIIFYKKEIDIKNDSANKAELIGENIRNTALDSVALQKYFTKVNKNNDEENILKSVGIYEKIRKQIQSFLQSNEINENERACLETRLHELDKTFESVNLAKSVLAGAVKFKEDVKSSSLNEKESHIESPEKNSIDKKRKPIETNNKALFPVKNEIKKVYRIIKPVEIGGIE